MRGTELTSSVRKLGPWLILLSITVSQTTGVLGQESQSAPPVNSIEQARPEVMKGRVSKLIASSNNSEKAWGAFLAGKYDFKDLAPSLERALKLDSDSLTFEQRTLNHVILDSLIKLEATLSPSQIAPLFKNFRAEAIILAANSVSENEGALLSLHLETLSDTEWLAIGNLLSANKAAGFAESLMRDLSINVSIYVVAEGGAGGGVGCGGSACGGLTGFPSLPTGFPPVFVYSLQQSPSAGAVAFSPGTHPIFYHRAPFGSGLSSGSANSCEGRDPYRVEYLAEMLGTSKYGIEFSSTRSFTIEWNGEEAYLAELQRIRTLVKESYQRLLERLVLNGLIPASELATFTPSINYSISDQRGESFPKLPAEHFGPGGF